MKFVVVALIIASGAIGWVLGRGLKHDVHAAAKPFCEPGACVRRDLCVCACAALSCSKAQARRSTA